MSGDGRVPKAYARRPGQSRTDLQRARVVEQRVAGWLGDYVIDQSHTNDRLDFWIPGATVEAKAKLQPLSSRWPVPDGCRPEDGFILDELSYRKALEHFPACFFVFVDVPMDRVFAASITEVACADRVRLNRYSAAGNSKGKLVLNLAQFRQLHDPAAELLPLMLADQVAMPWKQSGSVISAPEV